MHAELTKKIRNNPKFAELTTKRTAYGWKLSILMLVIYYGFILVVAFAPKLLGTPVFGVITLGIPVGALHHRLGLRFDRHLCPPRQLGV